MAPQLAKPVVARVRARLAVICGHAGVRVFLFVEPWRRGGRSHPTRSSIQSDQYLLFPYLRLACLPAAERARGTAHRALAPPAGVHGVARRRLRALYGDLRQYAPLRSGER